MHERTSTPATRFRTAIEMADFGVGMMLQNLRRAYPGASDDEIRVRLREWLERRPPDGVGRLRPLHLP